MHLAHLIHTHIIDRVHAQPQAHDTGMLKVLPCPNRDPRNQSMTSLQKDAQGFGGMTLYVSITRDERLTPL